jgi:hypothetical protein
MKFQWNNMTSFAKKVLKKLGAVPTSDLIEAEEKIFRLYNQLDRIAYRDSKKFPFLIEPEVFISYDGHYSRTKFHLRAKELSYVMDDYMIESLEQENYRMYVAQYLSQRWAKQTEEVLLEILSSRK